MFFEDDAGFCNGFIKLLDQAVKELPAKWDLLFLGGSQPARGRSIVKIYPYSPNLQRVEFMTGAYGVLVNHTAYDRMIKSLNDCRYVADIGYMKLGLKIFRTKRNLVLHRPGYSFIQKSEKNYTKLNTF